MGKMVHNYKRVVKGQGYMRIKGIGLRVSLGIRFRDLVKV